jgi:hypothetical protein
MEPVKHGLHKLFGCVAKGIATGLALRCDLGSQFTSEYFQKI